MNLTRRASTVALLLAVAFAMPSSSSGGPPIAEPSIQITNATWGPYERRYGEPMMMSVATLIEEMERGRAPQRQTIRTFGRFYPSIRRKGTFSRDPEAPAGSTTPPTQPTGAPRPSTIPQDDSSATSRLLFQLCDERDTQQYLTFVPFEEIADRLEADASSYYGQRAVVTGVLEAGVFGFGASRRVLTPRNVARTAATRRCGRWSPRREPPTKPWFERAASSADATCSAIFLKTRAVARRTG